MSDIFNLTKLSETNIRVNSLMNTQITRENSMISMVGNLTKLNESLSEDLKTMYHSIAEASDKEEENTIFCQYFADISKKLNKFILDTNEATSRFVITMDNIADANVDSLSSNDIISRCKEFHFKKFTFKAINNPDFPDIDPIPAYKAEFDVIGKLMQNLKVNASNKEKLEVIASVYNQLTGNMQNDWVAACANSIVPSNEGNFADNLYSYFRSPVAVDTVITKGMLLDIKSSMENRSGLIEGVVNNAKKLVSGFQYILDDIATVLYGVKDGKVVIKTDTDGIRDTSYSVDSYGINQLNIFLKTKFDQIIAMCNIYFIALSIKMDATLDYFNQCKEIINAAQCTLRDQETIDCKVKSEDIDWAPEKLFDDNEDDDDDDGEESSYEESCGWDDDFRSLLYETYEIATNYYFSSAISEAYNVINEADDDNKGKGLGGLLRRIRELFSKFFSKVAEKLKVGGKKEYIVKNESIITKNEIKEYKNDDGKKVSPKIDFVELGKFPLSEITLNDLSTMGDYADKDAFIKKYCPDYAPDKEGKTIRDMMEEKIIDWDNGYTDMKELNAVKNQYYNFINKDFEVQTESLKKIEKYMDNLENLNTQLEKDLKDIADKHKDDKSAETAKNESTESLFENTLQQYFLEKDNNNDKDSKPSGGLNLTGSKDDQNKDGTPDKDQKGASTNSAKPTSEKEKMNAVFKTYVSVYGQLVTAKLNILEKVFNICYDVLVWHIKSCK